MSKSQLFKIGILCAILITAGLILRSYFSKPEPEHKIRIGYLPLAASLPLFVATDQKQFEHHGLNVELIPFQSSNQLALAGASGEVDLMATCSTESALETSLKTGKTFKAFLFNQYVDRSKQGGRSTDCLLARKGVTLESLKGCKIAFFPGSVTRTIAEIVMPANGIPMDSFTYIEMPPQNWVAALSGGTIDAVHAVEPFLSIMLETGNYSILIDGYCAKVAPNLSVSGYWFVSDKISGADEKAVVAALREATVFITKNPTSAVTSYNVFTKISPEIAPKIGLNQWAFYDDPNPETLKSAREFQQTLISHKAISDATATLHWIYGG